MDVIKRKECFYLERLCTMLILSRNNYYQKCYLCNFFYLYVVNTCFAVVILNTFKVIKIFYTQRLVFSRAV